MMRNPAPPITDHLPVAIRAFAAPTFRTIETPATKPKRKPSKKPASPWAIVFDTETTSDAAQSLRFGTFQVRHKGEKYREGIFYAPDGIDAEELRTLTAYAAEHGLDLLTRDEFADDIFYGIGYWCRGMIVGFNLPFDISRIALRHGPARGDMRGGFTFALSENRFNVNVRVKHRSQSAAFIKFAGQPKQLDGNTDRKHGRKTRSNDGHFLDVKTLAKALLSRSFTLASLCEYLDTEDKKLAFDKFAGAVTPEMVRYAVRDTEATWQCFADLLARFDRLELAARPEKIMSEASIGKAYLRGMGIRSWQKMQPDFPSQLMANIIGSYFGGRAEVRIRRELRQVIHCDFLSMYPTVCTLMNLWPFVRGDGMTWHDSTDETRALLDSIDITALQSPEFWPRLATIVRVVPDMDIFPIRASYTPKATPTTGTNLLSGDVPLWLTLAECISSKLLSGKAPKIVEAVTFAPGPVQSGLSAINIEGKEAYRVDPRGEDFFKRVIELRQDTKNRRDAAIGALFDQLDTEQNALKIAANATSYGIYVEVNVEDLPEARKTTVHTSTCDRFTFVTDKNEKPGPFFHPLLATLICGAARLMLAITESLVIERGLEWSFCDTDSMSIAMPAHRLDPTDFAERVLSVVNWFAELNPYDFDGSILQIEKVNTALDKSGPEPLFCWAISAKRYALFNLAKDGTPIMRKISAHGLGHLLAPYNAKNPAKNIPLPHKSVLTDGVEHWQHDLWWQIVSAALGDNPDETDLEFHDAMNEPAMSQYAATTTELLAWFKGYNKDREPRQQVKPFNFLLAMIADTIDTDEMMIEAGAKPSRRKIKDCRPVSPYSRDFPMAVEAAFDRETGKPVAKGKLATYADALAQYHIHPEAKFLNGNYVDRGTTLRRHVRMIGTRHIGKEAHDLERQAYIGLEPDAVPVYGISGIDRKALTASVKVLIDTIGMAKSATALATNATRLQRLISGKISGSDQAFLQSIAVRLPVAQAMAERISFTRQAEIQALRAAIERDGRNVTARRLGIDPSNFGRVLRREFKTRPQ